MILLFAIWWMDLEDLVLSERIQEQIGFVSFCLYVEIKQIEFRDLENRMEVIRGGKGGFLEVLKVRQKEEV